jgi:radical SAM superfamily enzyme YgiQ (UPF0313 family)
MPPKRRASVRIALVYPNAYAVGMASLGFQTVYRLFNEHPDLQCERVFVPAPPLERELRSLESGEPLRAFSFIGVSIAYEPDLVTLVRLLSDAGIPPLASERDDAHTLVFAGGVLGGLNPSPLLPFVDAVLAGEGEGVVPRIAEILVRIRSGPRCRRERLTALGELDGVTIPNRRTQVVRQAVEPLEAYPTYTPVVTPISHFENRFVVELSRGCARRCLFCAGGKVYHPLRFHSPDSVRRTVRDRNPGARRVGLEGASLSDYPGLEELGQSLIEVGHEISFSSVRVDRITPQFLGVLEKGNIRSFTVAPEAGSESLRARIRKEIPDAVLERSTRLIAESPVEVLKLYFLIGLPGETDDDVSAMADLVRRMAGLFLTTSKRRIRLSVNAFVPKPFTEFQWAAMERPEALSRKRALLEKSLADLRRVVALEKSGREETLQAILAVGDERAGLAVHDRVVLNLPWKRAFEKNGVDPELLIHRSRSLGDALPWDFIQSGISKKTLWDRYQTAIRG